MLSVQAALPPRAAVVANAIAFRDPSHGVLGTGWTSCGDPGFGCRLQGTISLTTNGGRTWKVVLRTPQPVVRVEVTDRVESALLYDGKRLRSADASRTWRPAMPVPELATPCPPALDSHTQIFATPAGTQWALCAGPGGAGTMGKAVYRESRSYWTRVAYTPFGTGGYGGISAYGYPVGMAMADDGFGLIWESRGTLYVTRDAGSHWTGQPRVARPELDFGQSATVLSHGVGFVLLGLGGGERRRLLTTRDGGRTWRIVHRWH